MEFLHNGTRLETLDDNNVSSIVERLNHFISGIQQKGRVVHEIVIDGNDVTGELESYIVTHSNNIEKIEIRSITKEEMYSNLVDVMLEYLPKLDRATDSISNLFYGEPNEEAWTMLTQLTEGIQFVVQTVHTMKVYLELGNSTSEIYKVYTDFDSNLKRVISELENAIQSSDHVLMADLIKYEISEQIQSLLASLELIRAS